MKEILKDDIFDTILYPTDWRFTATILGLLRYFNFLETIGINVDYELTSDYLKYNQEDITEERYFLFVDEDFKDKLKYKTLLTLLNKDSYSDKEIKDINDIIKNNQPKIVKELLKPYKFDGTNAKFLKDIILKNEQDILRYSYYHADSMYKKYCNIDDKIKLENIHFLKPTGKICRLNGFYVDVSRKLKSLSWQFDKKSLVFNDIMEFDFIPFAFTHSSVSLFINNNIDLTTLIDLYNRVNKEMDENLKNYSLKHLVETFKNIEIDNLSNFNLEIISNSLNSKGNANKYYETLFLDKISLKTLLNSKKISNLYSFRNDELDINFFDIFKRILNHQRFDDLLNKLISMKENEKNKYPPSDKVIDAILELNYLIYSKGEEIMEKEQKQVYACAKEVTRVLNKINKNKIKSYKSRLFTALAYNSKENVLKVLSSINNETNVEIGLLYLLIEDYDKYKNLVYTFHQSLGDRHKEELEKIEGNENKGE